MEAKAADPLAGKREDLNEGLLTSLTWRLSEHAECPVKEGQVFELRSCTIEITSIRKTRRDGIWVWFVPFNRTVYKKKMFLLGKSGGYVEDPKESMLDDPRGGAPFEPEAVPPEEVAMLPSTQAAKLRHKEQKDEERQVENHRKEGERTVRDQVRHAMRGIPTTRHSEAFKRMEAAVREIARDLKR